MSAREGARVPPLLALAPSRLKKKSRLPRPQFRPPLFRDGVNPGYYSLSPDQLEDRQALALMAYTDVWDTLTSRDHEEDAYDQLKRWANGQPQLSDAMVPVYVFFLNAIERENGYETPPVEVRVLRRADGCVYSLVEPSDGPALGAELYAANADQMADANRRQARAAAAPSQLASRAWTLIDRVRAYVLEIRAAVGENLLGWNAAFREQFDDVVLAIERALWSLFRPYAQLAAKVRVPLWYGEVEFATLATVDYELLSKKFRSTTTNPQVTFAFARSRDKGNADNCCWGIVVARGDCLAIDVSEALPYKGFRCYDEAEVILAPGTVYTEVARMEPGTNFEIREVKNVLKELRADRAAFDRDYPMFEAAYAQLQYWSGVIGRGGRRDAAQMTHKLTRHNFEPEATALVLATPPEGGYAAP